MTNYTLINKSITKILWAYVFILFNITIGPVDILPDFVGYILMAAGIFSASEEFKHANLLKPLSIVMAAWTAFVWVCDAISLSSVVFTYISTSVGFVNILLSFLLLTDLSDICKKCQSAEQKLDKKLLTARTLYVLCIGASILSSLLLLIFSETEEILIAFTVGVSLVCLLLFIVIMILLFQSLSGLKKITKSLSEGTQNCCVPFSTEEDNAEYEETAGNEVFYEANE